MGRQNFFEKLESKINLQKEYEKIEDRYNKEDLQDSKETHF